MTLQELINQTRVYTRDFTGSIFREVDIDVFLKEAFNRCKIIPEFSGLTYPLSKPSVITIFPETHQYILAIYASSRCFFQDEQDFRAGTLMNEFENKLDELTGLINCGQIVIKDINNLPVKVMSFNDMVTDEYFEESYSDNDIFNTEPID